MKKISLLIIVLILFAVLLTGCTNKDIQSGISRFAGDYTIKSQFNGTVLVAKNDHVLLQYGYGMADFDNKVPNTPQTVFQIGSMTKQFTAAAIMMLQEKGLLNVQDTIDKYIPDYPNGNKIKIYNLLTHTSGIPQFFKYLETINEGVRTYTPKDIIDLFKDKPLDFDPGAQFEYTNSNYILLGYIIEKVTGVKYEDYIKNNIFTPLKMNHTGFIDDKTRPAGEAIGYSYINADSTVHEKIPEMEPTLAYSAGGIYSTAGDLLIWINSLCSGKLVSENSLKEMFTPNKNNYGFGWFISASGGDKIISHGGAMPGFSCYITKNISKGYVVIILTNKDTYTDVETISDELIREISNN